MEQVKIEASAAAPGALGLCDDCAMCWAVGMLNGRALCLDCGEWADLAERPGEVQREERYR